MSEPTISDFSGRCPKGIRRHYRAEERRLLEPLSPAQGASALGRPEIGVQARQGRSRGEIVDQHFKDPTGKYKFQEESKKGASRHGAPWEEWEDAFLISVKPGESLSMKAKALGRTYRAVESRRRDAMRRIDEYYPS